MTDYAELRAALATDAYVYRSTAIRALLAERDALRDALTDVLHVNETDAGDDVKVWAKAMLKARAALAQGQGD